MQAGSDRSRSWDIRIGAGISNADSYRPNKISLDVTESEQRVGPRGGITRFFLGIRMICGRHLRVFVDAEKSRNVRKAEIAYAIQVSANRRAFDAQRSDRVGGLQ